MHKRKKRLAARCRLLAVTAVLALSGCAAPLSAELEVPVRHSSAVPVAFTQRDGLLTFTNQILSVDLHTDTGEFSVTVLETGQIFLSNPVDRDAEGAGRGVQKMKLYSQLLVSFLDTATDTAVSKVSYTGSVTKDGLSYEKLENGVRLNYFFPDEGVTVPLDLVLDQDRLSARVDVENVEDSEAYRLYAFSILPYFESGNSQSPGYLLIPDGSGALVDFQTDRSNAQPYNQPVYGMEPAYAGDLFPGSTEDILLPVFGVSKPDRAFLAEIVQGAGAASIEAYSAGMINHHNTVYPSFQVIGTGSVVIGESSQGAVKETMLHHTGRRLLDCAQVDYRFLSGDTSYVGMACAYREVLERRGVGSEQADAPRLFMEFVGGVTRKESFFGFLVDRHKPLTTVGQAAGVAALKAKAGENLSLLYTGWSSDEISGKFPTHSTLDGALGSQKELKALADSLDGDLWLSYEPLAVCRSGNGFSRYADSAKRIGGQAIQLWNYRLSTEYKDESQEAAYLAKTNILSDGFKRFQDDLEKRVGSGAGLCSQTLGNLCYTDFSDETVTRDEAICNIQKVLEAGGKWALYKPAAYALPYTAVAVDIPDSSSRFDLFSEDVPFYQLAVSGLIGITSSCINAQDDPDTALLHAVETGASPYFRFFCADASTITDTAENALCYGEYAGWEKRVSELYAKWKEAEEVIQGACVVSRICLMDGVYKTVFDNGGAVYVNYGDETVTADGRSIPAHGFLLAQP